MKQFIAAAVLLGGLAFPALAQPVTTQPTTTQAIRPLTPDDYYQIYQLYSEYSFAVDTGDGPRRTTVFTPDATITSNLTMHVPGTMREMSQRTGRIGRLARPTGGHIMTNIVLTATPEGAKGVAYALIL